MLRYGSSGSNAAVPLQPYRAGSYADNFYGDGVELENADQQQPVSQPTTDNPAIIEPSALLRLVAPLQSSTGRHTNLTATGLPITQSKPQPYSYLPNSSPIKQAWAQKTGYVDPSRKPRPKPSPPPPVVEPGLFAQFMQSLQKEEAATAAGGSEEVVSPGGTRRSNRKRLTGAIIPRVPTASPMGDILYEVRRKKAARELAQAEAAAAKAEESPASSPLSSILSRTGRRNNRSRTRSGSRHRSNSRSRSRSRSRSAERLASSGGVFVQSRGSNGQAGRKGGKIGGSSQADDDIDVELLQHFLKPLGLNINSLHELSASSIEALAQSIAKGTSAPVKKSTLELAAAIARCKPGVAASEVAENEAAKLNQRSHFVAHVKSAEKNAAEFAAEHPSLIKLRKEKPFGPQASVASGGLGIPQDPAVLRATAEASRKKAAERAQARLTSIRPEGAEVDIQDESAMETIFIPSRNTPLIQVMPPSLVDQLIALVGAQVPHSTNALHVHPVPVAEEAARIERQRLLQALEEVRSEQFRNDVRPRIVQKKQAQKVTLIDEVIREDNRWNALKAQCKAQLDLEQDRSKKHIPALTSNQLSFYIHNKTAPEPPFSLKGVYCRVLCRRHEEWQHIDAALAKVASAPASSSSSSSSPILPPFMYLSTSSFAFVTSTDFLTYVLHSPNREAEWLELLGFEKQWIQQQLNNGCRFKLAIFREAEKQPVASSAASSSTSSTPAVTASETSAIHQATWENVFTHVLPRLLRADPINRRQNAARSFVLKRLIALKDDIIGTPWKQVLQQAHADGFQHVYEGRGILSIDEAAGMGHRFNVVEARRFLENHLHLTCLFSGDGHTSAESHSRHETTKHPRSRITFHEYFMETTPLTQLQQLKLIELSQPLEVLKKHTTFGLDEDDMLQAQHSMSGQPDLPPTIEETQSKLDASRLKSHSRSATSRLDTGLKVKPGSVEHQKLLQAKAAKADEVTKQKEEEALKQKEARRALTARRAAERKKHLKELKKKLAAAKQLPLQPLPGVDLFVLPSQASASPAPVSVVEPAVNESKAAENLDESKYASDFEGTGTATDTENAPVEASGTIADARRAAGLDAPAADASGSDSSKVKTDGRSKKKIKQSKKKKQTAESESPSKKANKAAKPKLPALVKPVVRQQLSPQTLKHQTHLYLRLVQQCYAVSEFLQPYVKALLNDLHAELERAEPREYWKHDKEEEEKHEEKEAKKQRAEFTSPGDWIRSVLKRAAPQLKLDSHGRERMGLAGLAHMIRAQLKGNGFDFGVDSLEVTLKDDYSQLIVELYSSKSVRKAASKRIHERLRANDETSALYHRALGEVQSESFHHALEDYLNNNLVEMQNSGVFFRYVDTRSAGEAVSSSEFPITFVFEPRMPYVENILKYHSGKPTWSNSPDPSEWRQSPMALGRLFMPPLASKRDERPKNEQFISPTAFASVCHFCTYPHRRGDDAEPSSLRAAGQKLNELCSNLLNHKKSRVEQEEYAKSNEDFKSLCSDFRSIAQEKLKEANVNQQLSEADFNKNLASLEAKLNESIEKAFRASELESLHHMADGSVVKGINNLHKFETRIRELQAEQNITNARIQELQKAIAELNEQLDGLHALNLSPPPITNHDAPPQDPAVVAQELAVRAEERKMRSVQIRALEKQREKYSAQLLVEQQREAARLAERSKMKAEEDAEKRRKDNLAKLHLKCRDLAGTPASAALGHEKPKPKKPQSQREADLEEEWKIKMAEAIEFERAMAQTDLVEMEAHNSRQIQQLSNKVLSIAGVTANIKFHSDDATRKIAQEHKKNLKGIKALQRKFIGDKNHAGLLSPSSAATNPFSAQFGSMQDLSSQPPPPPMMIDETQQGAEMELPQRRPVQVTRSESPASSPHRLAGSLDLSGSNAVPVPDPRQPSVVDLAQSLQNRLLSFIQRSREPSPDAPVRTAAVAVDSSNEFHAPSIVIPTVETSTEIKEQVKIDDADNKQIAPSPVTPVLLRPHQSFAPTRVFSPTVEDFAKQESNVVTDSEVQVATSDAQPLLQSVSQQSPEVTSQPTASPTTSNMPTQPQPSVPTVPLQVQSQLESLGAEVRRLQGLYTDQQTSHAKQLQALQQQMQSFMTSSIRDSHNNHNRRASQLLQEAERIPTPMGVILPAPLTHVPLPSQVLPQPMPNKDVSSHALLFAETLPRAQYFLSALPSVQDNPLVFSLPAQSTASARPYYDLAKQEYSNLEARIQQEKQRLQFLNKGRQ